MDKILKTLETIKVPTLSGSDANIPGTIISAVVAASDSVKTKKKERISHCRSVTDAICLPSVQGLSDFHKILESVVEVLFQLSSDPDSDIRSVASECLNRLVRTLKDSQQPKLHMEIYKEIRRNQNTKSLRTALGIFAHISSHIKPQKCRAFFASLLPCFVQISKRTEEYLYENLAGYYSDIFQSLGPFAQDQEIKHLCKEYITNLQSSSAIIRRASASILVSICQHSKKPHNFLPKLLHQVTGLLKPKLMENSVSAIIGSMQCIRHIISPLYNSISNSRSFPKSEVPNVVLQLVQVYEMCMILCNHDDHNVVTTSLETLQQLLTEPIEPFKASITSPNGIENSIDNSSAFPAAQSLPSHGGSLESDLEALTFSEDNAELLETDNDIPKFRSFLSSSTSDSRDMESDIIILSRRNSDSITIEENRTDVDSNSEILQHSDDESLPRASQVILHNFPELQIGSLYEKNPPVNYCARFLAYNFLLAGQKGYERPDGEIRISVKVLAINCLVNLVKISLDIYFLPLSHDLVDCNDDGSEGTHQEIKDVCLYASHGDPLLRGCTYVLVGYVLEGVVVQRHRDSVQGELTDLTDILKKGLSDSSNIGVKCAISAVRSCLGKLWRSDNSGFAEELFSTSLHVSSNPYWLVKADLIELLANVEWSIAITCETRKQSILNIILEYLSDEDIRVRNAAVLCLPKYINGVSITDAWNPRRCGILCPQCIVQDLNFKLDIAFESSPCRICQKPGPLTASILETLLGKLVIPAVKSDNKNLFNGYQAAIAHLSESYPPNIFKTAWHLKSKINDSGMLLGLYMDLIRCSTYIHDISVHQSVLKIMCNLFLASDFHDRAAAKGKSYDDGNPFLSNNTAVCTYGTTFMQHIIAVLKLYQNIIEQSSSAGSSRKVSTSPVISPVKKFSQKLEAEKKASESETDKKAKGPYFSTTLCPIHMRKINESITQSWKVYRCSLDSAVAVKFTSLLSACLDTLGKMFSVIRSDYPGMTALIEDVLSVTNSVFIFSPTDALKCVRKVLQSIFAGYKMDQQKDPQPTESNPRDRFDLFLNITHLLKFPHEEKSPSLSRSSAEVSALSAFIRQFEPAVVSGLRIYTTTSDIMVQVEVLRLLKQLISGHVNYGLVDSNQVFLGFVIKQIAFLEDGQIRDAALLVEEMFQFLTLLSHEHHATKSFVDVPKVLNLCDILVSSEYATNSGVRCLKPAVMDIIVKRFKSDRSNWEKKEVSTHSENLLQLITKAIKHPDVLPIMWILLSGRRQRQEPRWNEDSVSVLQNILGAFEEGVLTITEGSSFNYLIATLCALNSDAMPPVEDLITRLQRLLNEEVVTVERCHAWMCTVASYWVLIVKLSVNTDHRSPTELTGSFIVKLLFKAMNNYTKLYVNICNFNRSALFAQLFGVLTYSLLHLLQSDSYEDLKLELHSETVLPDWLQLHAAIESYPDHDTTLRLCCIDLLSGIAYPHTQVFEAFLSIKMGPRREFVNTALTIIINDLNGGDIPTVEEWIIVSRTEDILGMITSPVAKTFLSRLSKFRKGQFLEKIEIINANNLQSEELQGDILEYMKLVGDEFLCETAVLGIELLNRLKSPYLDLDVSHFVCSCLNHIYTRQMQFTLKDRNVIKSFIENATTNIRYPRLCTIAGAILGDTTSEHTKPSINVTSMIAQWCSEEITSVEGLALAKMLSSLKFTQVMNIFSQRDFNLRVLHFCFVHMRSLYLMDVVTTNDVISLFTSDSRSGLMEKWPLGVACVEFVVEKLDAWEHIVSDDIITEFESGGKQFDCEFLSKLPLMWECLTAMLHLKKAVIINTVPEDKGCYNNFIPTRIFTISFQYILTPVADNRSSENNIPLQRLQTFLNFASGAFSDPSFLSFFNVRDSPQHIFICVRSLRLTVEQLVKLYRIDWIYNVNNSEYFSEIDEECATVLIDFEYLMDFVFQVRCGRIQLDSSISKPLWNIISGLGRCELINGWILISHLRWRTQASWKSQIFPPIEPIPLEILRSDHELLLQYIFKLNVFGVASKIQFEENWVIFLSVINLYVDESFQLQIVSAGLKALSMLLQQCVCIEYIDKPYNEDLNRLVTKIDQILHDVEPKLCMQIAFPSLLSTATKNVSNPHGIDVNSCIRFLTDLYTQWLQNPQGKMPLLLLSEVVRSVVVLSEYFEETTQFQWMHETLMEVYKSFEKEDEVLWPHLMYGIFYSAGKIQLEGDQTTTLVQLLESAISSPFANVALTGLKCALTFLQNYPENLTVLGNVVPYLLKLTQLDETSRDAESHSFEVWKVLLFIWIHGPQEGFGVVDFEQDTLRNILTVLSPINKAFVSVRLLVLRALRKKVLSTELKSDVRKKITKVAYETLSTPNISIFIEALKLYTTIFYVDFYQFRTLSDPDPEVLMPMAERTEILFQLLKSGNKCNNQSVSKVLSLFILDFLPPSEILNRVIAEFMSPSQTAPELLAPVVAQVFEKSRRKPKEAALVREWILAGLPNFLNSSDVSRNMWSLTLFFIGVSSAPEVSTLLPFACLRRRTPQIHQLFIHSALDLYSTLDDSRSQDFRSTLLRSNMDSGGGGGKDSSPFSYLGELLNKADEQKKCWEIDSCSTP